MKPPLVATLALVLLVSGCAVKQRFRAVHAQSDCFRSAGESPMRVSDPAASAPAGLAPSLDCRHTLFTTGFIEFDQEGKLLDPRQEAEVLRLIEHQKKALPSGKVITLVYVHGWKNNAAEAPPGGKPQDPERFQRALLELGLRSRVAAGDEGMPVPVVGVYIGWRGKTLKGPDWFTFLSFWGRRNTANRVGDGPDLAGVLNHVIDKTNEGSSTSRVLLVGHSFGARVLEHAIETKKVVLFDPPTGGVATPRVDLVLYVNSANDSRLSLARVQALQKEKLEIRHPDFDGDCSGPKLHTSKCRDYPLLVAITSRGDLATKHLLRIANTVNMDKRAAPDAVPPTGVFADEVPSAGTFAKRTAAHMRFLHSHTVRDITCPAAPRAAPPSPPQDTLDQLVQKAVDRAIAKAMNKQDAQDKAAEQKEQAVDKARQDEEAAQEKEARMSNGLVCPPGDRLCRFAFRTQGERPACFQVDDRGDEKPAPFNKTAFWIMDVDPAVIEDHGDIWNLSFVEMLGQLMAPRGFFEPDAGRIQLRMAPGAP